DSLSYFDAKHAWREAFQLLALVHPSGATYSHLVAENFNHTGSFKRYEQLICRAAREGRKDFFIQLGKLLEGKRLKPNTWSKLDEDVAFILCFDPKIKSTDAVGLLHAWGYRMSELAFKQKKYNWKRAAMKTRSLLQQAGVS